MDFDSDWWTALSSVSHHLQNYFYNFYITLAISSDAVENI